MKGWDDEHLGAADLRARVRVDRRRGPQWYAKYRLPDGRQVQKRLGPAWTGRGRPPAGHFTRRTAQDWLDDALADIRRGQALGLMRTGATVADAAAEWLRWAEHDRACKPGTLSDYRYTAGAICRDLGDLRLEEVTPQLLERWKAGLAGSNRTVQKSSWYCTASSGGRSACGNCLVTRWRPSSARECACPTM